jgi:hypothetical protein
VVFQLKAYYLAFSPRRDGRIMARIVAILFLIILSNICLGQENLSPKLNLYSPYWSKPYTKTDAVWAIAKPLGFAAAQVDAWSTSRQIKRGYVESRTLDNLLIRQDDPALGSRSALQHGENYVINLVLQLAYNKCGPSKLCKWTVIGARGYFTGRSAVSAVHNLRLP